MQKYTKQKSSTAMNEGSRILHAFSQLQPRSQASQILVIPPAPVPSAQTASADNLTAIAKFSLLEPAATLASTLGRSPLKDNNMGSYDGSLTLFKNRQSVSF